MIKLLVIADIDVSQNAIVYGVKIDNRANLARLEYAHVTVTANVKCLLVCLDFI